MLSDGMPGGQSDAVTVHPDLAAFDRLKTRIQGLRAKTTDQSTEIAAEAGRKGQGEHPNNKR